MQKQHYADDFVVFLKLSLNSVLRGLGIKLWELFFGKINRSWTNIEMYKWKWMVLGGRVCMNNADFEKNKLVSDNVVLDVFIMCQKLWHV